MKLDRILSITMLLLLSRRVISAPELAKIFDVSARTIYRDVDTINRAGIPIFTETGVNGGISIVEEFKIDKYLFASDMASTMIALTTIYPSLLDIDNSYVLAKHRNSITERKNKKNEEKNNSSRIKVTLHFYESYKDDISKHYDLNIVSFESSEDNSKEKGGYYKAYIYIENNDDDYDKLLLLGDKCECAAPKHVREYIKNKIENMKKIYDNENSIRACLI